MLRIGTRGSELALIQARQVRDQLSAHLSEGLEVVIIKTQGDRITDRPLRELPGRGFFTREIEEALLEESVDLAVHSFKDLSSTQPDGLSVVAIPEREDPADLLLIRPEAYSVNGSMGERLPLREGAVVGTSAVRRQVQLSGLRSDLTFLDLRGNVPTRLARLRNGPYDAIFLASAAARRLNLELDDLKVVRLEPDFFVPAPGQGALALQMRAGDSRGGQVRALLNHLPSEQAVSLERAVAARFGGGCSLPLGAYVELTEEGCVAHGYYGGQGRSRWAAVQAEDPEKAPTMLWNALGAAP